MIDKDSCLLKKHGLMDYSLMLGIEFLPTGQKFYYLRIIDFLQDFTFQKKSEIFSNQFKKGKAENRSAVSPDKY